MCPGRPPALAEHVVGGGQHPVARREQQRRIEVALDGAVVADALPRLVERHAPVDADDVAAGLAHLAQDRATCRSPKWIVGTPAAVERLEDPPRVRQDELAVVVAGSARRPTSRRAGRAWTPGLDLRDQVVGRRRRRAARRGGARRPGAPYISALVCAKFVGVAALDRVRRQRERRAGEADERHAARQLRAEACRMASSTWASASRGSKALQPIDVGLGPDRACRSPGPRPGRTRTACPSARAAAAGRRTGSRRRPRSAAPAAA